MGYIDRPERTDLTKREKEVAKLLIKGYSNEEMAEKLLVSRHTIKRHVSNMLMKLKAVNRVHAAYLIAERNLDKD